MFILDYGTVVAELDGTVIAEAGFDNKVLGLPGRQLVIVNLPKDHAGRELTLKFTKYTNNILERTFYGQAGSMVSYAVASSLPALIIGILVFAMGAVLVFIYFFGRKYRESNLPDLFFGVFSMLTGIFFPGRTYIIYLLLSPAQITFTFMLLNYLMPITVLLFVLKISKRTRIPIIIALCIHSVCYLGISLMQIFTGMRNVYLLMGFQYAIIGYYALSVISILIELGSRNKYFQRLRWGLIALIIGFALDLIKFNPGRLSLLAADNFFFKLGLIVLIVIEISGRFRNFITDFSETNSKLAAEKTKTSLLLRDIEKSQEHMDEIKLIKHDMISHFNSLRQMVTDGKTVAAADYIDDITGKSFISSPLQVCEHPLVNAIVTNAMHTAENSGVDFRQEISIGDLAFVSDVDISTLISNIVDNALEGASTGTDSFVNLKINEKNGFLHVFCSNSHDGSVVYENGSFISHKNGPYHNLGLRIIRNTVNKYNGVMDIEFDDNTFSIDLAMSLKSKI